MLVAESAGGRGLGRVEASVFVRGVENGSEFGVAVVVEAVGARGKVGQEASEFEGKGVVRGCVACGKVVDGVVVVRERAVAMCRARRS